MSHSVEMLIRAAPILGVRGDFLLNMPIRSLARVLWPLIPPRVAHLFLVLWKLGYIPRFSSPQTFNEKIAHRKLFQYDPRFSKLADKWKARDYVREKVGGCYLTQVYQHVSELSRLDIAGLPQRFVLKGRHDSGSTILVDSKDSADWASILQALKRTMSRRHGILSNEYWYKDIPPGILVEERLKDRLYDVPLSFKFFVFHGVARFVQVVGGPSGPRLERFYECPWTPLPVVYRHSGLLPLLSKPAQLEHMVEVAEVLGSDFDFVRIDLYAPDDERVVFGEFTFAPEGGLRPFLPSAFDRQLGNYW